MTLKISSELINNLKDLIKIKMTLMVTEIYYQMFKKKNKDMDELLSNSLNINKYFNYEEFLLDDKWIMKLCKGTHAIMFFEHPIKTRIIQIASKINYTLKIRSIADSSRQNYGSIVLNRYLNYNLRRRIKKRYFNYLTKKMILNTIIASNQLLG